MTLNSGVDYRYSHEFNTQLAWLGYTSTNEHRMAVRGTVSHRAGTRVLKLGTDLVLALELTRLSIVELLVHEFLRDKLATITLWTLRHRERGIRRETGAEAL